MQAIEQLKKDHAFVIVSHRPSTLRIARCHYELIGGRLLPSMTEGGGVRTVTLWGRFLQMVGDRDEVTDVRVPSSEENSGLRAGSGSLSVAAFAPAVSEALLMRNDLGLCLPILPRALGWDGDTRHMVEALPYFGGDFDITGLRRALVELGF